MGAAILLWRNSAATREVQGSFSGWRSEISQFRVAWNAALALEHLVSACQPLVMSAGIKWGGPAS